MFLFGKSGFYVIQCDGLGTILVVEGDDQLVIVEINTIDESIDQPLAVRLLAQPHCGQGAGAGQSVPDHKHPTLVVMQDGQVVAQAVGARPKSAILAML